MASAHPSQTTNLNCEILQKLQFKSTKTSSATFKKLQLSFSFRSDSIEFQYECDGIFRNSTENRATIIWPSGSGTGKKKKMTGVNIQQE